MPLCNTCNVGKLVDELVEHVLEVDGRVYTAHVRANTCIDCGSMELDVGSLQQFEAMVACRLADAGARTGHACRFIRKSLGLRRAELADLLGVPLAAIDRWEGGAELAPAMVAALLGALADDRKNGRTTTMDRLRAALAPAARSVSLVRQRSEPVPAPRLAPEVSPADDEGRGPVLIVEDDDDIREVLRQLLEDEGYRVFCARHGQHALDILGAMPKPRVIVLDILMPIMNGWEFLRVLRGQPSMMSIPVVILSAVADLAPSAIAARFIRKPLDVDSLLSAVRELAA